MVAEAAVVISLPGVEVAEPVAAVGVASDNKPMANEDPAVDQILGHQEASRAVLIPGPIQTNRIRVIEAAKAAAVVAAMEEEAGHLPDVEGVPAEVAAVRLAKMLLITLATGVMIFLKPMTGIMKNTQVRVFVYILSVSCCLPNQLIQLTLQKVALMSTTYRISS